LEILLVVGLLAVLFAFVMPNMFVRYEKQRLIESAQRLRAQAQMVRAHAMADSQRYRIRWADEEDTDADEVLDWPRQPFIEYEPDPFETEEDEWEPAEATWVLDEILIAPIRCLAVQLGKPTEYLTFEERFGRLDPESEPIRPDLVFEPDGTCEWATFTLTDDTETAIGDLNIIDVIVDGRTGQVWLQQQLSETELDELEEGLGMEKVIPFMRRDMVRSGKPLDEVVRERQAAREEADRNRAYRQEDLYPQE
jgi:hypothetical protein